jgi:hypothetical protein
MWYPLHRLSGSGLPQLSTLADLMHVLTRTMLVVTTLFYGTAAILLAGKAATYLMGSLFVVTMLLVLLSTPAYHLLEHSYLTAQSLWQLAFMASVIVAMHLLGRPEILLLLTLMPLIAGISIGWPASLVPELILIGVTW